MPASQGTLNSESTRQKNLIPVWICLALAILTVIIFGSLKDCDFINLDDNLYVYKNVSVQSGLNVKSMMQAFSFELAQQSSNWHPLTWLSLMFDYQIFGLNPQGYHLINLLFHVMGTILLFLVLRRMTKTLWPSAFVAALFAIHPLHVESVAWISERKDVLSACFWMLTMGAYSYYVESPGFRRYCFVLLFFIMGLMAKPMLVTLPFVLLLLDYWPLQRFGKINPDHKIDAEALHSRIYPLLWEKVPLFALAILSSIVTYIAQQKGGAVHSELFPLFVRIGNAFVSYIAYIGKTIWPCHLAILYPHSGSLVSWQVLGSIVLLIAITSVVILRARKFPYLAVGWLWYLGTLVPVIGFVQVGAQAMADRYTYIPLIGLFIMVAWGVPDLLKKWNYRKEILWASSALILLCLSLLTWTQVGYWQGNITLYDHALSVTDGNWFIHYNRGIAHSDLGNYRQAIEDYSRTIEIKPDFPDSPVIYYHKGMAYNHLGNYQQAIENYNEAIKRKPDYLEAYYNRGTAFAGLGNYRQAIEDFSSAIKISPRVEFYFNRGIAQNSLGNHRQATEDYGRAIEIKPHSPEAYFNRGVVYLNQGNNISGCRDAQKACELGNCQLLEAANARGVCR